MKRLTAPQRELLRRVVDHGDRADHRGRKGLAVRGRGALCVPILRDTGCISVEDYTWAFDRNNYWVTATDAGVQALSTGILPERLPTIRELRAATALRQIGSTEKGEGNEIPSTGGAK